VGAGVAVVDGASVVGEDARRMGAWISEMIALICCWSGILDEVGDFAALEGDNGVCGAEDGSGGEDGMEESIGEVLLSRIRRFGIILFSGGRGAFASGRDADGESSRALEASDCSAKGEEVNEGFLLMSLSGVATGSSSVPNLESSSFSSSASCIVTGVIDERFPGSFEAFSMVITNGLVA